MKFYFKHKFSSILLYSLLLSYGCVLKGQHSGHENCYDIESFKDAFKHLPLLSVSPLTKELEFNTKSLEEIKDILDDPIEEYTDTFKYGCFETFRDDDISIDRYYYCFPDTFWEIPLLIIHKCVWNKGNKDITLFFAKDCEKGEQPFAGYVTEYDDYYTPLRLLQEKNLSINQVVDLRGRPIYENVDTVNYGAYYSLSRNIYSLRNIPNTVIHEYRWRISDTHTLLLIYLENEAKDKSVPVFGMLCNNIWFDYE